MFVGHTAVALAAKSNAPGVSLGWFIAASFGLDLLWPNFLLAGIALYVRATRATDRIGSIGFWAFVVTCTAIWASSPWAELPPSANVLAWVAQSIWLLVLWAWWVDRHRVAR